MLTLIAGAGWVAVALAAVGAAYALAAAALLRRFLRRASPAGRSAAVSMIKPLHGAEPGLEQALRSFCEQDYAAPRQLLLGVQDGADPAVDVVRQLQRAYPALDIELVIDPRQHGANRKISNVINLAARAKHPVLVLSDSDIRVPRDYLTV